MMCVSQSEKQTFALGKSLAEKLCGGEIITLDGELGAGKTVFTKGIAAGLGVSDSVVSPTFTLMNEYAGRLKLVHIDAYRLSCGEEAYEAGIAEAFGRPDTVCVIEWHCHIASALYGCQNVIGIRIEYKNERDREIYFVDR